MQSHANHRSLKFSVLLYAMEGTLKILLLALACTIVTSRLDTSHCIPSDETPTACEVLHNHAKFNVTTPLCPGNVENEDECKNTTICCWTKLPNDTFSCRLKPGTCYIDFRPFHCPCCIGSRGLNDIFCGHTFDNKHCYVGTLSHNYAILFDFPPILGVPMSDNPGDFKVFQTKTYYSTQVFDGGKCNVTYSINNKESYNILSGNIWGNDCVIKRDNKQRVFSLSDVETWKYMCKMIAWKADQNEETGSKSIQQFVMEKTQTNKRAIVVQRIIRSSWQRMVALDEMQEIDQMMDTLVGISNNHSLEVTYTDAENILVNNHLLAEHKFYGNMENESAMDLIQSATTVLQNVVGRLTMETPASLKSRDPVTTAPPLINETPEEQTNKILVDGIQSLEQIVENVATRITLTENDTSYEMSVPSSHFGVKLSVVDDRHKNGQKLTHKYKKNGKEQLAVATKIHDGDLKNVAMISIVYDNMLNKTEASDIIVINVRGMEYGVVKNITTIPVEYKLDNPQNVKRCKAHQRFNCFRPNCEYLTDKNEWNDYGCFVKNSTNNATWCSCNHTTHFAVLMHYVGSPYSPTAERVLELMSILFGVISVICLFATLCVFLWYRKTVLKERMIIHFHLVVALLCGYISFMCSTSFTSNKSTNWMGCFLSAMFMHFFYLATFFWFLVEGIYLYYKIVHVFKNRGLEMLTSYSWIIGWILPLLIVLASIVISRFLTKINVESGKGIEEDAYFYDLTCFLQVKNGMIWAFMGPVCFILLVNSLILLKILTVIYKSTYTSTKNSRCEQDEKITDALKNSARGAGILLPILGCPWIINLFTNTSIETSLAAAYIHVVLVGTQGIFIFFVYCIYNAEVKSAKALSDKRKKSISSLGLHAINAGDRKRSRLPLLHGADTAPSSTLTLDRTKSMDTLQSEATKL